VRRFQIETSVRKQKMTAEVCGLSQIAWLNVYAIVQITRLG
jgi:hypothetical protein